MQDLKTLAMSAEVEEQRNWAQNRCASLRAKLALAEKIAEIANYALLEAQAKNAKLEERVKELQAALDETTKPMLNNGG